MGRDANGDGPGVDGLGGPGGGENGGGPENGQGPQTCKKWGLKAEGGAEGWGGRKKGERTVVGRAKSGGSPGVRCRWVRSGLGLVQGGGQNFALFLSTPDPLFVFFSNFRGLSWS